MLFGVVRPGWDVEGGAEAHPVDGHCFYGTYNARCFPGSHNWEGTQAAQRQGRATASACCSTSTRAA